MTSQDSTVPALGAHAHDGGTRFAIRSATEATLCLFDASGERRIVMTGTGGIWSADVAGVRPGQRYGYRTAADPAKLLVDPHAVELDRPFRYDPSLGEAGVDTTPLVPRAIVPTPTSATSFTLTRADGLLFFKSWISCLRSSIE